MKIIKKRSGFTLLELSVATAVFAFFLTIIIIGTINVMQIFQKTNTVRANQQAARGILEEIRREASFAENITLIDLQTNGALNSGVNLKGVNYTQGDVKGLCIQRNSGGQVMYFVDYAEYDSSDKPKDYQGTTGNGGAGGQVHQNTIAAEQALELDPTLSGDTNTIIAQAQSKHILNPGVSNTSHYYFSTKRVYKSYSCDPTNFRAIAVPVLGANNSNFDNVNVQFMRLTEITTGPYGAAGSNTADRLPTTSVVLDIMTTQLGPPGRATNSAGNPGKQYDDTLLLSTVVTPSVSQF